MKLASCLGLCIGIIFLSLSACAPDPLAKILFTDLPSDFTGLNFRNNLNPTDSLNIITYLYYYNGGGIAAGDINNDGLVDLFFTANQAPNALFINRGNLRFEDITLHAGLSAAATWSTGAAFVDIDADGDLDLYVCKASGYGGLPAAHNELYINDGTGHFVERAAAYGLAYQGLSTQAAFFDADGDGDLDCYLLNHSIHDTERVTFARQRRERSVELGDRLLLQNEAGKFVNSSHSSGIHTSRIGYGLGIAVADLSNDGLPDLYISNDFSENDYFYVNLGDGTFRESIANYFPYTSQFSMGNAAGDVNADGLLDIITLDMRPSSDSIRKSSAGAESAHTFATKLARGFHPQYARNCLHINQQDQFLDVAPIAGIHSTDWSWAPILFDADLDGNTDLFIANGIQRRPNDLDYLKFSSARALQRQASNAELASLMPQGLSDNVAYRGSSNFNFVNVTQQWGLSGYGSTTAAIAVDLDNDGDAEIVTTDVNGKAKLYQNHASDSLTRSISLSLLDHNSNRYAFGATVTVRQGNYKRAYGVQPVTGFQSSVVAPLLVYLPHPRDTFELSVAWPQGQKTSWTQLVGSQTLTCPSKPSRRTNVLAKQSSPAFSFDPCQLEEFSQHPIIPYVVADTCQPLGISLLSTVEAAAQKSRFFRDIIANEMVFHVELHNKLSAATSSSSAYLTSGPDGAVLFKIEKNKLGPVQQILRVEEQTYVISAPWHPVRRIKLSKNPTRSDTYTWHIDTIAPAGLWQHLALLDLDNAASDQLLLLGNVGLNTLLTELPGEVLELHIADYDQNGRLDPILVRESGGVRRTVFGLDEIAQQMPPLRKFFTSYLPFSSSTYDAMFPEAMREFETVYRVETMDNLVYSLTSDRLYRLPRLAQLGAAKDITLISMDSARIEFRSPLYHPQLGAYGASSVVVEPGSLLQSIYQERD